MDTVSMLNTMRFYCQPILPLVYDESMSYYETLCKVVGQLNTTGETVNKLNEGLTNEISDRQAADAALDERLKVVEATNEKIHFLVFDGANPNGGFPTRHELYQWVEAGDAIFTLFRTNEEGRGQIYAASCSYNAGNWGSEASNDFNIIVPIETSYDATQDYAVKQKVAKLTIPPIPQTNLNAPWSLQIIEINTPHTFAEGMVNFIATSDGENVSANITPADFIRMFDAASFTSKLCVGVNARLNYNSLELGSSVATVYDNSSAKREVRITFVPEPHAGRRDYVHSEIFDIVNIAGDKDANTWKIETFGTELFDFLRYEGFRFTRKAGNVIEADEGCDPASVARYYSDQSGKDYQNLPIHLIDEVDNADYWNGVFDSYSDGHITFTFTTANYAAIGEKMVVRVIELSATKAGSVWTGAEKWNYAAKEFDIPYRPTAYALNVWETSDTPTIVNGYVSYAGGSDLDFDDILPLVEGNQKIVATLHKGDSATGLEWSGLVYSSMLVNDGIGSITFATTEGVTLNNGIPSMDGIVVFRKDSDGVKKVEITFYSALPAPRADGSDNGKVPTINGNTWELKTPDAGGGSPNAVLYTPQTLTDAQKKQARANIDADSDFVITATLASGGAATLDKTFAQIRDAITGGRAVFMQIVGPKGGPTIRASLVNDTPTNLMFSAADRNGFYSVLHVVSVNSDDSCTVSHETMPVLDSNLALPQLSMASTPDEDMEIATKKYVDDHPAKDAVLYTAQELTFEQKQRARKNIEALPVAEPTTGGVVSMCPELEAVDSNAAVHVVPSKASDEDYTLTLDCGPENWPVCVKGIRTPADTDNNAAANVEYVKAKVAGAAGATVDTEMSDTSTNAVQNKVIKKYVDAAIEPYIIDSTVASDWQSFEQFGSTFEEIYAAIQAGKNVILTMHPGSVSNYVRYAPVTFASPHSIYFDWAHSLDTDGAMLSYKEAVITNTNATQLNSASLVGLNNDYALPQITMASAPTEDMEIATKQYVDDKAKKAVSIKVQEEEVRSYNYTDIDSEITNGGGNVWLSLGTSQMRMVACDKLGASSYELTFVNLDSSSFNIHTITVSPSAASYRHITK